MDKDARIKELEEENKKLKELLKKNREVPKEKDDENKTAKEVIKLIQDYGII